MSAWWLLLVVSAAFCAGVVLGGWNREAKRGDKCIRCREVLAAFDRARADRERRERVKGDSQPALEQVRTGDYRNARGILRGHLTEEPSEVRQRRMRGVGDVP